MRAKIAILASGEGANFEALVQASRQGGLEADVVGLITNRSQIGALGRAQRLNVPARILSPKTFSSREEWDRAVMDQLQTWGAEWVVLAGFLVLMGPQTLKKYSGRMINIHPSLLPKFGGPGMFGDNVHRAVLEAKESESGVTVHFVDAAFDQGRRIAQARVKVETTDTVETLARRVKALELSFYAKVVNDLVTGRITTS